MPPRTSVLPALRCIEVNCHGSPPDAHNTDGEEGIFRPIGAGIEWGSDVLVDGELEGSARPNYGNYAVMTPGLANHTLNLVVFPQLDSICRSFHTTR